jgi:hypothetical protein
VRRQHGDGCAQPEHQIGAAVEGAQPVGDAADPPRDHPVEDVGQDAEGQEDAMA